MNKRIPVFIAAFTTLWGTAIAVQPIAIELDGFVQLEAESFVSQTADNIRQWKIITPTSPVSQLRDLDENHSASASGKSYIEILPDTRVDHSEKLVHGENISNVPGKLGVLSYPIQFTTPGRYWVWASAFSTGSEDNGIHVGLNGEWPKSGERMQWCEGKNKWTWSSAQRVEHNHCGYPNTIYLDIPTAGLHTLQISMREDGAELDRLILVNDMEFFPDGFEMPNAELPFEEQIATNGNIRLGFNDYEQTGHIPFYKDYPRSAFAINAAKVKNRKGFARATSTFPGPGGEYSLHLTTLTELDGESTYRISVNGKLIQSFQNLETKTDYMPALFKIEKITLKKGDLITVEAHAHTNGKVPEKNETAWARGRWQKLIAIPANSTANNHQ